MFGRPEFLKNAKQPVISKPEANPQVASGPIPGLGIIADLKEVATMGEPGNSPDISIPPDKNALIIQVSRKDLKDSIQTANALIQAGLSPENATTQALILNYRRSNEQYPVDRTRLPDELALALLYKAGLNDRRLLDANNRPLERQFFSTDRLVVFIEERTSSSLPSKDFLRPVDSKELGSSNTPIKPGQQDPDSIPIVTVDSVHQSPAALQLIKNESILRLVGEELSLPESWITTIRDRMYRPESEIVPANSNLNRDKYNELMEFARRFSFWMIIEKQPEVPPALPTMTSSSSIELPSGAVVEFSRGADSNDGFLSLDEIIKKAA